VSASVSCGGVLGGTKNLASSASTDIRSYVQCSQCQRQPTGHSGGALYSARISLLLAKMDLFAFSRSEAVRPITTLKTLHQLLSDAEGET